jgi:hypothetical protein
MRANARTKRLLILLGVVALIGLLRPLWGWRYDWFYNNHFNSQAIHLRQVEEHIQAIRPQWQAFTNQNPGFEDFHLFAFTGGDGRFAASGSVPDVEHLKKLIAFMEGTKPPRPIFLGCVSTTNSEALDLILENIGQEKR